MVQKYGKRPLERPRREWKDNIRMNLNKSIGMVQIGLI